MEKFYLTYTIDKYKLLKVLKKGYLLSKKGYLGLTIFSQDTILPSPYIFYGGMITLFFDISLLFKEPFRYATGWSAIKVDYRFQNVYQLLMSLKDMPSAQILIKGKIRISKYLKAICCDDLLSNDLHMIFHRNYPYINILTRFPKTASQLYFELF